MKTASLRFTIVFLFYIAGIGITSAQNTVRQTTVWVNASYLDCIDSSNAICHCDKLNPFLLAVRDSANNILKIQTSIHKSWEGYEFDLSVKQGDKYIYEHYDTDSQINWITQSDSVLLIKHGNEMYRFIPKTLTVHHEIEDTDLGNILGSLNARILIKAYLYDCETDSFLFKQTLYFHTLVETGDLEAYCPDDGYYESFTDKKNDKVLYLMVKDSKTVLCFSPKQRARRKFIDNLEPCYYIKWIEYKR